MGFLRCRNEPRSGSEFHADLRIRCAPARGGGECKQDRGVDRDADRPTHTGTARTGLGQLAPACQRVHRDYRTGSNLGSALESECGLSTYTAYTYFQ